MKNKIAEVFYDKEVSILGSIDSIDAEGGVKHEGGAVTSTFKGNVNFSKCKEIQEEYGLDYEIDIVKDLKMLIPKKAIKKIFVNDVK